VVPEDLQVPGYDIEERIGRGGMASVYRARQHTFDRDVALKVLKSDLSEDESFCQRFVQESLIVAKLHHSNIVQVYDVGEFSNSFYIAMEYLNGGDLNAALKRGLAVKHTVQIIKQCASALDFAHKKGIIHRDIKPDNIMFREDGAAVLTDFGIAKEVHSDLDLTQTGLIVGTPKFMAPEQIRGSAPSPQADIYSLGILLFQCLTDEVPFHGKDMVSTAYKHFNDPVPDLPPMVAAFQPIVEKMLAKQPEDRYERALDIIDDLDELTGESQTSLTNLDITKDFIKPSSDLDPTIVHAHNQGTLETDAIPTQAVAQANLEETVLTQVEQAEKPSGNNTENDSKPTLPVKQLGLSALGLAALAAVYFTVLSPAEDQTEPNSPPITNQTESSAKTTLSNATVDNSEKLPSNIVITIDRLLAEAKQDIAEKRLKKPDANNAYDKLERVLRLDPENPHALASMGQIAEEYAKLADAALGNKHYFIAQTYLDHASTAADDLKVIDTLQSKLDTARKNQNQQRASIQSLEKSLMIEGLLESALIDEQDGRLLQPAGENALEKYQRILELDPANALAQSKLSEITR